MARAKRHYIPGKIWHLTHLNGLSPATEFQKEKHSEHYEKLRELLSIDSYDLLKEYLDNGSNRQDNKWWVRRCKQRISVP